MINLAVYDVIEEYQDPQGNSVSPVIAIVAKVDAVMVVHKSLLATIQSKTKKQALADWDELGIPHLGRLEFSWSTV